MSKKYNALMPHEAFKEEFLKKLREVTEEKRLMITKYILPVEEYAAGVGYLNAYKDLEEVFEELYNTIYPTN